MIKNELVAENKRMEERLIAIQLLMDIIDFLKGLPPGYRLDEIPEQDSTEGIYLPSRLHNVLQELK